MARVPGSGAANPTARPVSRPRLLLADDDPLVRRALTRALARSGYDVVDVADGGAALERFTADPDSFDVVVLDRAMPVLTGDAVLPLLHAVRRNAPVIMLSGHIDDDHDLTGASAVIRKGSEMRVLVEAIQAALAN